MSVNEFKPKGIEDWMAGHRFYLTEDIDRIIACAPGGLPEGEIDIQQADPKGEGLIPCVVDRRTALIDELEHAAAWYDMSVTWSNRPSPSELVKRFGLIQTACERLLQTLGILSDDDPDGIPRAILYPLRRRAEKMGKLRRFIETEVCPWYVTRKRELENRPLIQSQIFGEACDPSRLEKLIRYEFHLDRKFERTLGMLLRLAGDAGIRGSHIVRV